MSFVVCSGKATRVSYKPVFRKKKHAIDGLVELFHFSYSLLLVFIGTEGHYFQFKSTNLFYVLYQRIVPKFHFQLKRI